MVRFGFSLAALEIKHSHVNAWKAFYPLSHASSHCTVLSHQLYILISFLYKVIIIAALYNNLARDYTSVFYDQ